MNPLMFGCSCMAYDSMIGGIGNAIGGLASTINQSVNGPYCGSGAAMGGYANGMMGYSMTGCRMY